jgi:hypothetical protein
MAELTVNTERDPDVLTEDELDSLRVGEELQAEQQDMLAGKFKDAEELEKAYMELQQKLGQPRDDEATSEPKEEEEGEVPERDEELTEAQTLIGEASKEFYANDGTISTEMMDKLGSMDAKDLVQTYMEMQALNDAAPTEVPDLSDREVMEIQSMAGGSEEYSQMTSWAGENLPPEDVQAFDSLIATGQMGAIRLAVAGLRSLYSEKVGYEGRMLSGKSATDTVDAFRSQAEVVRAMQDPRYENDPAYRNDVFNKLDRSNLDW